MIRVRCFGHIATSVDRENVELDIDEIHVCELIDRLRELSREPGQVGFNRFNTLAIIEDGAAFVPASKNSLVRRGEKVVLIPFSHGG